MREEGREPGENRASSCSENITDVETVDLDTKFSYILI